MMLDEQQPDLVFITTPWHLHIPHATESILRNCHVALEIEGRTLPRMNMPPLLEIAQQKGVKVFPLENALLDADSCIKRMADEGVLGEIIYMERRLPPRPARPAAR